jgi:uncharacterized OsmC-like protein
MYARTRGWDVGGVRIEVDYDHKADPRGFEITVTVPRWLSPAQVERLRRVAETCPIRRALETGFEFDERFVAGPHEATRAA